MTNSRRYPETLRERNERLASQFTATYKPEARCGRCGIDQCEACKEAAK